MECGKMLFLSVGMEQLLLHYFTAVENFEIFKMHEAVERGCVRRENK